MARIPDPTPPDGTPRAIPVGAAVALAALTLYVVTLCPTVPFGDGGELIGAMHSLGVPHPPGYPWYTLLGRAALSIPLGEPAARTNALSALCSALACGGFAAFLVALTRRRVAGLAGGALAATATVWMVSVTTEVYAAHLGLIVALLALALAIGRADDDAARRRATLAAGAVLGLGLAHHPTLVLALPSAAVLAAGSGRGWRRVLPRVGAGTVVAAVAIALAVFAGFAGTLWFRARLDAPVQWGAIDSPAALWDHVRAAAYRHLDLGWAGMLRPAAWSRAAGTIATEATWVALPLALVGLAGRIAPRGSGAHGRARLALGVLMATGLLFGLRYVTDDAQVFLLPAVLAWTGLAGIGLAVLATGPDPRVRAAAWLAGAVLIAAPLLAHGPSRALRSYTAAADYGRDVLASLPEDSVLFVQSDDAFPLVYLREVLGERRDVTVLDRNGNLFRDVTDGPGPSRVPGESEPAWRIRREQAFVDRELARDDRRTVAFLGWPGYDPPPAYRMEPVGLVWHVRRRSDPAADPAPLWAAYRGDRIAEQAGNVGDPFALAVAALYPLARGERALHDGDLDAALPALERAGELGSGSADLLNYVGTLHARRGDWPRAIAWFERAVERRPSFVGGWNNLARARALAGDDAGARDAWNRSLAIAPGQDEARGALRDLDGRRP